MLHTCRLMRSFFFVICAAVNTSFVAVTAFAESSNELLIIGLGRVGLEVAKQALENACFSTVLGTVREQPYKDNERSSHHRIERLLFDSLSSETVESSTHILFTIPAPDTTAQQVIESVIFPAILSPQAATRTESIRPKKWLGLISTTGVYGNHNNSWVTEKSACLCDPDSSAGRLLDFESRWQDSALLEQVELRVFRCAGIYGASRSALHTVYKHGLARNANPNHVRNDVTNRIHEHDIAAAIVSSMLQVNRNSDSNVSQVFNLADDHPESRQTVLEYATELLKGYGVDILTRLELESLVEGTERSSRRGIDRKRVSNLKMKQILLPKLTYPTYREGLLSVLQHSGAPWCK